MATPDRTRGTHSRIVRIATIVLPVGALALLSTLFLLARTVDPNDAIPFAEVDVSERARDQQLTAPRLTGLAGDGTAFVLSAASARPDPDDPRRMTAETMRLVLEGDAGGRAVVSALRGRVDSGERAVDLAGAVRIQTSTGFTLRTERLLGSLAELDIVSPGEVTGDGPLGDLRAGGMRIDEDEAGAARLVFTDGVDLLYVPPTR
ncbi:LPS export ABC transporter periplasmic protein LptC [Jannaschia sp. KMU-145]|uniref:LPS export ABC transporter periplasmic protein LptC n=1 Tax=Jannaschia halovivens TaxID=3388667 RepID=UPI00396B14B1